MSNSFVYHGPVHPCPVCGGVSDCRTNTISGGTHCRRGDCHSAPDGWRFVKEDAQGFGLFFLEDRDAQLDATAERLRNQSAINEARRKVRRDAKRRGEDVPDPLTWSERSFNQVNAERKPMTDRQRERLGEELGRPDFDFSLLGMQFLSDDGSGYCAFVFPMSSAGGDVIGFSLRYRAQDHAIKGSKKSRGKGDGLFLPVGPVGDSSAPIFLPEGASDTLTLLSAGLLAVGRPSNRAGLHHMIELLRHSPPGRRIIIVGERDRKADGRWPGREGAEYIARELARALDRVIYVTLPPTGYKDVREFACANPSTSLADIGAAFLAHAQATAEPFTPNDVPGDLSAVTSVVAAAAPVTSSITPIPQSMPIIPRLTPTPRDSSADAPPAKPRCPTPKKSIYRNDVKGRTMVMFHPCRRLNCPVCRETKKQQYFATIHHHLDAYAAQTPIPGDPAPPVYSFWTHESDWDVVSSSLRAAGADYFRINPNNPDGNLLVVATVAPTSTKITALAELPIDVAKRKLCSAIESLPYLPIKAFTSSRDWSLIDTVTSGVWHGWRRICGIAASVESILHILEHHKIDRQPVAHQGLFWAWQAWQWDDGRTKWGDVVTDLIANEVISDLSFDAIADAFSNTHEVFANANPPPSSSPDWW